MIIRGPGAGGRTGCGATGGRGALVAADAGGAAELDPTGGAAGVSVVTDGAGTEGALATGATGLGATGGMIIRGGAAGVTLPGAVGFPTPPPPKRLPSRPTRLPPPP